MTSEISRSIAGVKEMKNWKTLDRFKQNNTEKTAELRRFCLPREGSNITERTVQAVHIS